jgi:hypothetical protein
VALGGSLAAAAALLLAAAGCSGTASGADGPGKVASIASPGGAAPAASGAGTAPRERLDGTAEDYEKLTQPYFHCVKDHGGAVRVFPGGLLGKGGQGTTQPAAKTDEIEKACDNLFPLPPAELDPALNANFEDERRAFIACMTKHGVKVKISGKRWAYEDGAGNWTKFDSACMVESFGKNK